MKDTYILTYLVTELVDLLTCVLSQSEQNTVLYIYLRRV